MPDAHPTPLPELIIVCDQLAQVIQRARFARAMAGSSGATPDSARWELWQAIDAFAPTYREHEMAVCRVSPTAMMQLDQLIKKACASGMRDFALPVHEIPALEAIVDLLRPEAGPGPTPASPKPPNGLSPLKRASAAGGKPKEPEPIKREAYRLYVIEGIRPQARVAKMLQDEYPERTIDQPWVSRACKDVRRYIERIGCQP